MGRLVHSVRDRAPRMAGSLTVKLIPTDISPQDKFSAATWNVLYTVPVTTLEPVLRRMVSQRGVDVLYMQEAGGADLGKMLEDNGFNHCSIGQCRVAWGSRFVALHCIPVTLSATPWFSSRGEPKRPTDMPLVVLGDQYGRTLTAGSYHTPPHVQIGGDPDTGSRRVKNTEESMRSLRDLNSRAVTDAVAFAGDDNFDEALGRWSIMLRPFTGLRLHRPPQPTHGKRSIDDFRTRGLRTGASAVFPGGGDHRIHWREFWWPRPLRVASPQ